MKNKLVAGIILATFLLAVAVPVLAGYYANLQVVESSGNSYDQAGFVQIVDIDYMADNGYITSTGLDTRVTSGGTAMPHMLAEDRLLFANDITAYGTDNLLFTTGNTALSSFPVITGYCGYVTTSDHANLELGDDFEIAFEGWVDTSYELDYPSVESSTASSEDTEVSSHDVDLSSGVQGGDLLLIIFGGFSTTSSPVITWPGGWTSAVKDASTYSSTGVAYRVADGTEGSTVVVTTACTCYSAHQAFRIAGGTLVEGAIGSSYLGGNPDPPSVSLSWSDEWSTLWVAGFGGGDATVVTVSSYPANYDTGQTLTASSAGYAYLGTARRELTASSEDPAAFTLSDSVRYNAWTIGIRGGTYRLVYKDSAFQVYNSAADELTAGILGGSPKTLTVSGLTSGEYLVEVWADGTDFGIDIDGSTEDSTALSGASVPDNANDWVISIPYCNSYNHTVGVNHRIRYEPDSIIVGATLPNEENPGTYDGAITWGANPSGVAVSISGLVSDFQPQPAGGTGQLPTPLDVAGPSGQPGWTAGIQALTTHPLYPLVLSVSDQTNIPVPLVWVLGATLILAMVMVWMIGDRQILHQMLIALAGGGWAAFCYHMGIYPFWVIYIYAVLALAIIIGERSPTVS